MNLKTVDDGVGEVLEFLGDKGLKPEEKIAILRSSATLIENVIAAETMVVMLSKGFEGV